LGDSAAQQEILAAVNAELQRCCIGVVLTINLVSDHKEHIMAYVRQTTVEALTLPNKLQVVKSCR